MQNRDSYWMGLALQLASRGRGRVEPNPMVGCVIVHDNELISSGYHRHFGGPHAEVEAISKCDPKRLPHSTLYVTLEPCSHFGKTPPCVDLILRNRPKRVVVAMTDPFPAVSGRGISAIAGESIQIEVGVLENQARDLNAPYLHLLQTGRPWVIAKWAMTIDGAMATRNGDSKWISNDRSRHVVHELRARVDAVIVGAGTAMADDPMLDARMVAGNSPLRIATRVVLDRRCRISIDSKLVQSADRIPVLIAVADGTDEVKLKRLQDAGCEMLIVPNDELAQSLSFVLRELGNRKQTNVLLEGGSTLLGSAFDAELIDEVHCFIAPKIIGGLNALRPISGNGVPLMSDARALRNLRSESLGQDIYIRGMVDRKASHIPN